MRRPLTPLPAYALSERLQRAPKRTFVHKSLRFRAEARASSAREAAHRTTRTPRDGNATTCVQMRGTGIAKRLVPANAVPELASFSAFASSEVTVVEERRDLALADEGAMEEGQRDVVVEEHRQQVLAVSPRRTTSAEMAASLKPNPGLVEGGGGSPALR